MSEELPEADLLEDLLVTAVEAARAGAEVLEGYFRTADLEIESKGGHDFVTRADHESEARVIETILRRFPDHQILAEESGWRQGASGTLGWFIDPLDGTSNYLQGLPIFCVSIACVEGDRVLAAAILDPMGGNLFTARRGGGASWNGRPMRVSRRAELEGAFLATGYPFRARGALDLYLDVFRAVFLEARGIRRCGSAALDLAYTAAGVYDGFFELRLSPWDIAAGILLVEEAGGQVSDLDGGRDYFSAGNVIAGPERLQEALLAKIREHVDEARLHAVDPLPDDWRNKLEPPIVP